MSRDSEPQTSAEEDSAGGSGSERPDADRTKQGFSAQKLVVLILVAAAAGVGYWMFGDAVSFENLVAKEAQLRGFQARNPVLVYGVAFAVYVAVTGLSLPGATVLSLAYAWFFGFVPALILVSFSSTAGATVAFVISRYVLRDAVQEKFGDRLVTLNAALEREGAFYLFTMRLIPAIPFFVINVVMGLTPVRVLTFWWVSQVGMLPGTAVYVYAGSRFPDLETLAKEGAGGILTWDLVLAFVVLGLFPITVKKLMAAVRRPGPARIK